MVWNNYISTLVSRKSAAYSTTLKNKKLMANNKHVCT